MCRAVRVWVCLARGAKLGEQISQTGDAESGALGIQVRGAGHLAVQAWGDLGMKNLGVEVQLSKAGVLSVQEYRSWHGGAQGHMTQLERLSVPCLLGFWD